MDANFVANSSARPPTITEAEVKLGLLLGCFSLAKCYLKNISTDLIACLRYSIKLHVIKALPELSLFALLLYMEEDRLYHAPKLWISYWAINFTVFSCDQAALQMVFSVCLSVCPSVCPSVTPFSPSSHHRIIMKFSGVITMVKSDVHAKGQGQRSKVKVTEVNTQLSRFRTLTPVWNHIWQWNHAHSWKQHRRGALLFFKVIRQISRSHGSKNRRIWPRLGVSGL